MNDSSDETLLASNSAMPLLIVNGNSFEKKNVVKKLKKSTCADIFQIRYIVVLLCVFGTFNIYATRVAMSMALVCMVNHTAVLQLSQQHNYINETVSVCRPDEHMSTIHNPHATEDGSFVWDEEWQGIILSSFFWGYVTTQLAGGFIADRWGGKWIWGYALLTSSVVTMLIPIAARSDPAIVIILRILCGIAQGFTFPAVYSIIGKWAPVQERTRLLAISYNGVSLGIIATYPVSAALCSSDYLGGWPAVFYLFGALGFVWFALWCILMHDQPSQHPWITRKEREYIESNNIRECKAYQVNIPWSSLVKSIPLWALCLCEFCQAFKFFMMLTQLPTYLKVVTHFNLQQNGIISSVPLAISMVVTVSVSWICDSLTASGKIKVPIFRKFMTGLGAIVSSLCLLGIILISCNRTAIVALLWISAAADSLNIAGLDMNPYDLSPNFSGTIKGIVQTFGASGGIVAPYIVGALTKNNNTKSSWNTAFYIAVGLHMSGTLLFTICGSGRVQSWNNAGNDENETEHIVVYERKGSER